MAPPLGQSCGTCFYAMTSAGIMRCHGSLPLTNNLDNWRSVDTADWCIQWSSDGSAVWPSPSIVGVATGALVYFMTAATPSGYLLCDGAAYLRVDYPALYAAIDVSFHIDADNFNVPDMRGYFARGLDLGAGVDPARVLGTTQADAFASHDHTYNEPTAAALEAGVNAGFGPGAAVTGATGGTETRPKNMAWRPCIKT